MARGHRRQGTQRGIGSFGIAKRQAACPAAPVAQIEAWLRDAGFQDIAVTPKPESRDLIASWAPGTGIENCVVSATIEARKP